MMVSPPLLTFPGPRSLSVPLNNVHITLRHCWSDVNTKRVHEAFSNDAPPDVVVVTETGELPRLDAPTERLTPTLRLFALFWKARRNSLRARAWWRSYVLVQVRVTFLR